MLILLSRIFLCFFVIAHAHSERSIICPSVEEIKNKTFHHWLPLYIEGEELASEEDTQQFIQGVEAFRVAKWDEHYLENGHCFYHGTPITHQIILAHDAWRPKDSPYWHWIHHDKLAECHAFSPAHCVFLE